MELRFRAVNVVTGQRTKSKARAATVLISPKLIAKGVRQVCHEQGANEGGNGVLKGALHRHDFTSQRIQHQKAKASQQSTSVTSVSLL